MAATNLIGGLGNQNFQTAWLWHKAENSKK
jgi:hypothetical protein